MGEKTTSRAAIAANVDEASRVASTEAIRSDEETAKRERATWAAEFRRRDVARGQADVFREPAHVEPIPEACRQYHPDGSWCARGAPCALEHLRGRPGDPEPSPVRPEVMEQVGLPVDPAGTPDGLFVQTVYGRGAFVMERYRGQVHEIVGPFASGERCRSIIDGMRVGRMQSDRDWRELIEDASDPSDPEGDPPTSPALDVPRSERHYHKDGSWCREGSLCERAHIMPALMELMVAQDREHEVSGIDLATATFGTIEPDYVIPKARRYHRDGSYCRKGGTCPRAHVIEGLPGGGGFVVDDPRADEVVVETDPNKLGPHEDYRPDLYQEWDVNGETKALGIGPGGVPEPLHLGSESDAFDDDPFKRAGVEPELRPTSGPPAPEPPPTIAIVRGSSPDDSQR